MTLRLRRRVLFAIIPLMLVGADKPNSNETKEAIADLATLHGVWRITETEGNSESTKLPTENPRLVIYLSSGDYVLSHGDFYQRGTITVDPSTSPKQIDYTAKLGKLAGTTFLGIYEVDGDTHRICFTSTTKRPRVFKTTKDDGALVWRMVRVKAKK